MDINEIRRFRAFAEALKITDLYKGRFQSVHICMVVEQALSAGLRVSEMVALKVEDIDLTRGALKVVRLKRAKKKAEAMEIGKEIIEYLWEYFE
jgi:integrase